jgi:CDP-4-dehydro-6-deoxyglucose reductase
MRAGITLPYGCRTGACGSCKGSVIRGDFVHGNFQPDALTVAEETAGKALFCCAKPLTDLVIGIQEVHLNDEIYIRKMPCRVQKIDKAAADVVILYLKLPDKERFPFMAGQYIDLLLKNGKRRSFSMANAPHDSEFLQLHIRYRAGGNFSNYVFGDVQEKTILRFEGPFGTFFLREESDKPIIFIAGGTGFAPIKAIIEHALHRKISRTMILYWGARALADLYMAHLPARWQMDNSNFTFVPVLSNPKNEDRWPGRTGLVHQAILEDFDDLSGFQVYASGAAAMCEIGHKTFTSERGLPEDEFYSDAFTLSAEALAKTGG